MKTKNTLAAIALTLVVAFVFLAGCDSLRFAPSENQKKNAYLHERATMFAAQQAKDESASQQLQALTELSHLQSGSYTAYFGLPVELPSAYTAQDILAQSNYEIANASLVESAQRPDPWDTADALLDLGIGLSAILGGVYGTKAVKFLQDAKAKSQALKEVIKNNELFKSQNPASADSFKQAQQNQSPETKILVTELKNGS
ncbi:MAG: hypothetical protein WC374_02475 [Phycisphaerae bacterium]|jgi:hypothetical protein